MARRSAWRRLRRATRGPRNWLLAHAILGAGAVVGTLPVRLALGLGGALGTLAYSLLGTARRLALRHVGMAFPELGPDARRTLVRGTFRHAGMSFAELALWPKLARRPDYVRIEGAEALDAALAAGHGAIAVAGHLGNWELLAATIAARGYPLTVVARRVNDLRFHALIARFRTAVGIEILLRDAPTFASEARAALARNRIVALLIDQDSGRSGGVFVPFFGRPSRTQPGAALLALRTRAPVVSAFIERRPEGGHRIRLTAIPVEEGRGHGAIVALTARFTAAIEAQLRRVPVEWVWWHERWRRHPDEPSPARRRVRTRGARALRGESPRGSSAPIARQE
jgi:KDO2-lipid IV(A) lauroyltransferase